MIGLLGHAGRPPAPHDLWSSWSTEPFVVVGIATASVAVVAAWRRPATSGARVAACAGALLALAVALVSPLDALSRALASAHMVQHVLLVLVAAPLLAMGAPLDTLLRAWPLAVRRRVARAARSPVVARASAVLRRPVAAWMLHAGTLWLWHSAVLYDAAVRSSFVHAVEHVTFLVTAVLFWKVVLGTARGRSVSAGVGLLLVFTMALQSVLLAALLTFAPTPWYDAYATTTAAWGLDRLADQQLAGVIMWVPAGFIYLVAALALLARWMREADATPTWSAPSPRPTR